MSDKFDAYLELLMEANKKMNLTAIREPGEIRIRHFEDSLKLLECADFTGKRVLDIGSGAGFPGLALKIARPDIELTLLEATGKKAEFLRRTALALELDGVRCLHGRAEEIAHTEARESFDIVTARGVAALPALCELCLPFVKPGGLMLAMKESGAESAAVEKLGGKRLPDFHYRLSNGIQHTVIIVEKITQTPLIYPRSWTQIKNRPVADC